MSLPRRSIGRPVAVSMLFVAAVFLGLISFRRLPIDLLPQIAYPKLVVFTRYENVGPAEIERFVTEPIEQEVSAVPGVEHVESASREGVSLVTLRFAWGTDMDFAALNVREKLDNLRDRLPEQAERPSVLRTDPGSEPILAISVAGGSDLWTLKDLAESVFRRRLEQVDGVAEAAVTGGLEREIHVDVDPARLEAHGVTIEDIARALDAANISAPGGTVRKGRYRYSVRTQGELQDVGEIGEIEVRSGASVGASAGASGSGQGSDSGAASGSGASSAFIPLRELATVTDGFQERESEARYDGRPAVGLLVFKESGANTVRVAKQVGVVLAQLRTQYPAIRLEVATSQAGFVSSAIANVVQALLLGGALAFLVLILFLRDVRYPIAIALAIPISVVVTFALMDAAGISLNVMTLGGLALGVGMLVDNSIVVLENVFRHREQGGEPVESAGRGAEEVQSAITASTLTTIAVFGPIVYVEGVAGELFGALSLAVAFSLLASLLVALTLLPTMAARWKGDVAASAGRRRGFFRRPLETFDRAFERFAAAYEVTLARALRRPGRVVASSLMLLVVAAAVGLTLRRDVLPHVDQGEFDVRLDLPRGTPLERTAEAATRIEDVLRADPAVADVFTRVGRQAAVQGFEDEETGLNTALLAVRLKEGEKTEGALARIRPKLTGFPPGSIAIETGTATALGRLLGGRDADLAVQVRGEDLDAALAYARHVEARLESVRSIGNVRLGTELGQPEVRVEIDRERAASYGIDPRDISDAIRDAMQGTIATQLADFDRRVPIVVRLPDAQRRSLASLASLRVDGVPLRELVHTVEAAAPTEIRRVDQNRQVSVLADVVSGGVGAATADVENALAALPAPHGLRVVVAGENDELRQGFHALGFAFLLAMLLVYMILAAQFESLLHPFVVLLTVPLGVMGALLALGLTGAGLNTLSLIGMVVLVGIGVNDAVVKVDFINQMRRQGMPLREAVLAAGHARLRPILMTTVTTLLGVLPMALGLGRGGELQRPLAIAVFGGLTATTALTLIVIPVAYEAVEGTRVRLQTLTGVDLSAAGHMRRLLPWRRADPPRLAIESATERTGETGE